MRVVLDTSAVRVHIHEQRLPVDLLCAQRHTVRVSLSGITWVELLVAIHRRGIQWDDWVRTRGDIDDVLDPELPVILDGWDLNQRTGLAGSKPKRRTDNADQADIMWFVLRDATAPEQLSSRVVVTLRDGSTAVEGLESDPEALARRIVAEGWSEMIESWQDIVPDLTEANGGPLSTDRLQTELRDACAVVAPGSGPRAERLSAPIAVLALALYDSLRPCSTYNPRSDRNRGDHGDWVQLWILALDDAVLCTEDKGIRRRVEAGGSGCADAARRIVDVDELTSRLRDETLCELVTPQE